jgi:hypothetical protein
MIIMTVIMRDLNENSLYIYDRIYSSVETNANKMDYNFFHVSRRELRH